MANSYDELRERYANSIWLRSEVTELHGPLRNDFDPPDDPCTVMASSGFLPEPSRFRVVLWRQDAAAPHPRVEYRIEWREAS